VKRQIVVVEWADAHSGSANWISIDELDKSGEVIIVTAGFLLPVEHGGRDKHVTIVQSFDDTHVDHVLHIPVDMVRCMKTVGNYVITSDRHHV
jgi:hypothetical protein